jgi:hypothetical protein
MGLRSESLNFLSTNSSGGAFFFLPLVAVVVVFFVCFLAGFFLGRLGPFLAVRPAR